jgi:hypothetical protein
MNVDLVVIWLTAEDDVSLSCFEDSSNPPPPAPQKKNCEVTGSHGGQYQDYGFLGLALEFICQPIWHHNLEDINFGPAEDAAIAL